MITTERQHFDRVARILRDHGASRSELEREEAKDALLLAEYNHLGYNYRMTDIQGALGCAQMERATWILAERSRRARRYDDLLADVEWLQTPVVPAGYTHGYQAYVCLFRPEKPTLGNVKRLHEYRNELMIRLETAGIATRQGTHAPVMLGYYAEKYGLRAEQFPNAYLADRLSVTLPLYAQMTDIEQETVVAEMRRAFAER